MPMLGVKQDYHGIILTYRQGEGWNGGHFHPNQMNCNLRRSLILERKKIKACA